MGIVFRSGLTPATAQWDDLLPKIQGCYRRASRVRLSAFGRGFASAAYGISRLLHAAEYVGLPTATAVTLQRDTTALVDRDEPPGVLLARADSDDVPSRSFAGVRWDLLCGSPETGGLGALNFHHHHSARAAKWGVRLLLDGTSRPLTRLAWAVLAARFPRPSVPLLASRHLQRLFHTSPTPQEAVPPGLPAPLRRLLDSLHALPVLGRRIGSEQGELQAAWLPTLELVSWRLHHAEDYVAGMMQLGTPVWAPAAAMPGGRHDVALCDYSVRLGTHLLTTPALLERAHRFRLFIEEVGGTLPPAVAAPAAMRIVLSKLWRLPLPNTLKQTYWYCFLNGMPT